MTISAVPLNTSERKVAASLSQGGCSVEKGYFRILLSVCEKQLENNTSTTEVNASGKGTIKPWRRKLTCIIFKSLARTAQ